MHKFNKLYLILTSIVILFVSCSNGTENNSVDIQDKTINIDFLINCKANILDAKAIGISKRKSNSRSADVSEKNFLVKTSKSLNDNIMENDLLNVTFIKNTEDNSIITQEEINAEIDKIYTINNYIFVSFVPEGKSLRPSNEDLVYDSDGISTYDKKEYYSDDERASFIIDSKTGLIYKIEDFHISTIENGLLTSSNDNYLYDFKINDKSEIEIYSLFTNDSIKWEYCFKDKYGNHFISNNVLRLYDDSTNTFFYTFSWGAWERNEMKEVNYIRTSKNEALELKLDDANSNITSINVILENGNKRLLTSEDNFKLFYNIESHGWRYYYKVKDGILYCHDFHKYPWEVSYNYCIVIDLNNNLYNMDNMYSSDNTIKNNYEFIEDYDVILQVDDKKVYYYDHIWDSLIEEGKYERSDGSNKHLIASDITFEWASNSFVKYEVNGTTNYEIVVTGDNNNPIIEFTISGSYHKPQIIHLLQPINND